MVFGEDVLSVLCFAKSRRTLSTPSKIIYHPHTFPSIERALLFDNVVGIKVVHPGVWRILDPRVGSVTCKEGDRQLTFKLYDTISVQLRDDCTESVYDSTINDYLAGRQGRPFSHQKSCPCHRLFWWRNFYGRRPCGEDF